MKFRLMRNTEGASSVEYGIVVSLIGIVSISAVAGLGGRLESLFGTVKDEIALEGDASGLFVPPGGALVQIPGEEPRVEEDCRTDTAGNDNFIDGGGRSGGTPVDTNCYLLTEGGENQLQPDGSQSRDYYVVAGGADNYIDLNGGINNTIVWQSGYMGLYLPSSVSTTVYMKGLNRSQVDFNVTNSSLFLGLNGNPDDIHFSDQFQEGGGGPGIVTNLVFEDMAMSASEIHAYAIASQQTDGDDDINGTPISETFAPGAGNDILNPAGGDDTIIYESGDLMLHGASDGTGNDTLDLQKYTSSQVSLGKDGYHCTVTTPDGVITLRFMSLYSQGDGKAAAETILFSDGSMNEAAIRAGCVDTASF